jgi:TolB-like protein/Tfp pilus assembly protein PilF
MDDDEVTFGRFRLRLENRELMRDGAPVRLGGRALEILCVLATAKGQLVSKDELMAKVWPGLVVGENAIQVHVSALRKAIEESDGEQSHILTLTGRGYRLVGLDKRPAPVNGSDAARLELALPNKPSIAILPFQNMSSDPEQEYFADGMVEDIVSGLARIKWIFVTARNSSFIYKGKAVDRRQVGNELGVRYLLEGGVRKSGNRVRITCKLIEASTGEHLWVEQYDRVLDDIFALQDEISMSVVGAIEPNVRKAEIDRIKRKRPESLDAYDLVLRAFPFVCQLMAEGAATAAPLLHRALAIEPDYPFAHAALAWCYHCKFSRGMLREEDRVAALHHAKAAVTGGADDATALAISGLVIWFDSGDAEAALDLFHRALALSNSSIFALCCSAAPLAWMGKTELAIDHAQRALRLSPFDPLNFLSNNALALSFLTTHRYAEALEAARRAAQINPTFSVPLLLQTAALVRLGRKDEARDVAKRVLILDPNFSARKYGVVNAHVPVVFAPLAEAWRAAGLPEV